MPGTDTPGLKGTTLSAVPRPVSVSLKRSVIAWPILTVAGDMNASAERYALLSMSSMFDKAVGELTVNREFSSCPVAMPENTTVPVPSHEKVQVNISVAPPAMDLLAGDGRVISMAPPVPKSGDRFDGFTCTLSALALPVLVTNILTVTTDPILAAAGLTNKEAASAAPFTISCAAELFAADDIGDWVRESVPDAFPLSWKFCIVDTVAVYSHVNVTDDNPGMLVAAGEGPLNKLIEPEPIFTSDEGVTADAVAVPILLTIMVTVNICPVDIVFGDMDIEDVSVAGDCI